MSFCAGQLVWVDSDSDMGLSRIVAIREQLLEVRSLKNHEEVRSFHAQRSPLERVLFKPGMRVKLATQDKWSEIESASATEVSGLFQIVLTSGEEVGEAEIVEVERDEDFFQLYAGEHLSKPLHFFLRIDVLNLLEERSEFEFPGAIGCRVEALPHQFAVVDGLRNDQPIRGLLADEVGLGKTIEAGLLFSYLYATRSLKKVMVIAPQALKVQWLTECYRRFNVKFRLDHDEMIDDGDHRDFVISSPDALLSQSAAQLEAQDLLVVDEAHRIFSSEEYAPVLEGLCSASKNVLFLTATPLASGKGVFERMKGALASKNGANVPYKIFQSSRSEIVWEARRELHAQFVESKYDWLKSWLKQKGKSKTFVICHSANDAVDLFNRLKADLGDNFALFHEGLDLLSRDKQAAYFAEAQGAHCLVSSEVGGEGRNFQFCQDLVMWDLPLDPLLVEQRIGRLDRIGQKNVVKVWCPIVEGSKEEQNFELLRDSFEVFDRPWTGAGIAEMSFEELLENRQTIDKKYRREIENVRELIPEGLKAKLEREFEYFEDIDIKETLLGVYDAFGVEVTDVNDNQDATIAASSLMFVDYFPGVGSDGERLITFSRDRALAHEDKMFFSLDHPDVLDAFDFFLNSALGKLSVCEARKDLSSDIVLQALVVDADGNAFFEAWSCVRAEKSELQWSSPSDLRECDASVLNPALVQKLRESYRSFQRMLEENNPACRVEGLLVVLPS